MFFLGVGNFRVSSAYLERRYRIYAHFVLRFLTLVGQPDLLTLRCIGTKHVNIRASEVEQVPESCPTWTRYKSRAYDQVEQGGQDFPMEAKTGVVKNWLKRPFLTFPTRYSQPCSTSTGSLRAYVRAARPLSRFALHLHYDSP